MQRQIKSICVLMTEEWTTYNPHGSHRVIVTKQLVGERWLEILIEANCRVEACTSLDVLSKGKIIAAFAESCEGAIGQLTEQWDREMFQTFKSVGGRAYSNVAVGYNNVDVAAATSFGIAVGNTPGVLTETTAELTVALTLAVARRITEADAYVHAGKFSGWQLSLFLGDLLRGKTLGVLGTGRIGSAYARMMIEGFRMNLIYFDRKQNKGLEDTVAAFNRYLAENGEQQVHIQRAAMVEEAIEASDVVSLHPTLNESTRHWIDARRLKLMKRDAILINVSRGPVIDEQALVDHCRKNLDFRVGLDVYEDEPNLRAGLAELNNVVLLPHIGSATHWTREAMSTIAARNVAALLSGLPVWRWWW